MSYATVDDVQTLLDPASGLGLTISDTSRPNATEVQGFLDQASARIDAALRKAGYPTIPATHATDVSLIAGYVAKGAAVDAWDAHASNVIDTDPKKIERWAKEFDAFVRDVAAGNAALAGQSAAIGGAAIVVARLGGGRRSRDRRDLSRLW